MIDICEPFEDFEYNAVGNYRCFFIVAEHLLMTHLSILLYRMPEKLTPTKFFVRNVLTFAWPLMPLRVFKGVMTMLAPFESSQSHLICFLIRIETTLQYTFSLSHLQLLTWFTILVSQNRSVSFTISPTMKKTLLYLNVFALINASLFVNLRIETAIFSCIYALAYCGCFLVYFPTHYYTLIVSTCRCFHHRKKDDPNDFSFLWFYAIQFLVSLAHFYQFCAVSTFIVPVIFPRFAGEYTIMVRSITGVLAVRFLVAIIFAVGPTILLPPLRRQILKPIRKLKQDRVATVADVSPDQVHVTIT